MKVLQTHIVPEGIQEIRLYDYVSSIFPSLPSRSAIKKAITRGKVVVNGEPATTGKWVKPGQKIELLDLEIAPPKAYHLDIDIVFEDEHLVVINKPGGIPVSGNQFKTIQNALVGVISPSTQEDALQWAKPVHRLDSATSGLLLIAKTAKALMLLGQMFEAKKIQKKYCAVVSGKIPKSGTIDFDIDGLASVTDYARVEVVPSLRNEFLSLVDLYPQTGRTHQIRKHLSELGYPIMGDALYCEEGKLFRGKGLFLCAIGLRFTHPITQETVEIQIQEPNKYSLLMEREKRRFEKYHSNETDVNL